MNNHAGVLDLGRSSRLDRIKSQEWPSLPPEVRRDLDIALMTPGFTHSWWCNALNRSYCGVFYYRKALSDDLIPAAIENYHSITRDDCLRMAKVVGHKPIPVRVQLVSDIHAGMKWAEAMKLYGVDNQTVARWLKQPNLSSHTMPDWFRSLIPGT